MKGKGIFDAILGRPDIFPVHAILRIGSTEDEVAISNIRHVIAVLTVLGPDIIHSNISRNDRIELEELSEERFVLYVVLRIIDAIPTLPKPIFIFHHRKWRTLRIHGENCFPTRICSALEKRSLTAECQTVALPACRAFFRWRNRALLPGKHRAYMIIECEVVRRDLIRFAAPFAGFLHDTIEAFPWSKGQMVSKTFTKKV